MSKCAGKRTGLARFSLLLLLLGAPAVPAGGPASDPGTSPDSHYAYLSIMAKARPLQHQQGDWVVRGHEVAQDAGMLLTGNLIVKGGASLTLRNSTLAMDCRYDGQFGISVEPGGSLAIHESIITAAPRRRRFHFTVRGDGFVMANSELHGCGWGDVYPPPDWADPRGLLLKTDGAVLQGNLISGNYMGAVLVGQRIRVTGNAFRFNDRAVLSVHSSDNQITGNHFYHASESDFHMLYLVRGSHRNTIEGNTFVGECLQEWQCGGGITAHYSWDNRIAHNTMDVDWSIGLADGSCNNRILYNQMTNRELSVYVYAGANNIIEGNHMHLSGDGVRFGILLTHAHDTIVAGNTINTAGVAGQSLGDYGVLYLDHCTGSSILNNRISGLVDRAVFLHACKENTVAGNRVSDSWQGIFLFHHADGNSVSGNAITSTVASIVADDSSGNRIHGNQFHDLGGQPYDNGDNQWDHQGRGNYWSQYQGQDADLDGIGDTPFLVPPSGIDRYPLSAPPPIVEAPVPGLTPISFADGPRDSGTYRVNVTGVETIENQYRVIETGQIVVQGTGTLTLRNCTWILGSRGPVEIEVQDEGSLRIENSVLRNAEGGYGFSITVWEGRSFVMTNSELHGASMLLGGGLTLQRVHSTTIENSTITGSHVGVGLARLSSARVVNNTFSGNGESILVDTCDGVTIEGNTIHDAVWRAIGVMGWEAVRNVTVRDNDVLSTWGDGIDVPENSMVVDNQVSGCQVTGLSLRGDGNTATGNTVSGCGGGISVHGSGNLLYHNNLQYNGSNGHDTGSNLWDHRGEGNYWSDYGGPDVDGDGIGDVPHVIPPNGLDRYPLMAPHGTPVGQTFRVLLEGSNRVRHSLAASR